MDDKAPGAFRTISEVADELDLPQHVLRFWESRFNDIKPMKRGGGRRYYRPDDIDLLRGIRHLLYGEGYTIRGVQRILKEQGVDFVQSIWQEGSAAAQLNADDSEDVEETLEADAEEDAEEEYEDEAEDEAEEESEGPRLRDRLTSFIGRDLNERSVPAGREEPPMQDAPMPRIDPGERFGAAPTMSRATPQMAPAPRAASGLSTDQRDRLRQVLDDLQECRKLIDAPTNS